MGVRPLCGLSGFLSYKVGDETSVKTHLTEITKKRALLTLNHRGPDNEDEWQDKYIWLGHRRLSIVDTTHRGDQPMHFQDFVIIFNGMIYNYKEIKRILIQKGYQFNTNTDTEIILAGWVEWKQELLPKLDGMFAFALWDKRNKHLILARDRFGKKPLYYRNWRGAIAFGSRFDSIEKLTENAQLSQESLSWLLTLKYIPEPLSASDKIQKLPAGHILKICADKQTINKWYDLQPESTALSSSTSSQGHNLKLLLEQAVAKRLVSDVPIACFLSGGLDSAIIACLANKRTPINTFTVGFDENIFDESKLARDTAKYLGTNHYEIRLRQEEQFEIVDDLFNSALDEPFGDSSALPSLFVSKAVKQYATVALSGDGADELFGGYKKYQGELAARIWLKLPQSVRCSLKRVINRLPRSHLNGLSDKLRQLQRFVHGVHCDELHRHATWMEVAASTDEIQQVIINNKHQDLVNILRSIDAPKGVDSLSLTLLRDIQTVLISDMLVKIDRTSMHAGVEVRSPFLDHHVVEMALAIKGKNKISWRRGKKILRDVFKDDLPKAVFNSPKRGFEMPLNSWLSGPLQSRLKPVLSREFLVYNDIAPELGDILDQGIKHG